MLAQIATDAKSKERAAVSELLQLLLLKRQDRNHRRLNCQRDIARQIVEKRGVTTCWFSRTIIGRSMPTPANCLKIRGTDRRQPFHRRQRSRQYRDSYQHGFVRNRRTAKASSAAAFGCGWPGYPHARDRGQGDDRERLLLTQRNAIPERLGRVIRSHWGVENRLDWVLNVVMNEDQTRSRNDNSAYNFAILHHMALNLMQNDRSKVSLRSKFNLAGWKDEFLAGLLASA